VCSRFLFSSICFVAGRSRLEGSGVRVYLVGLGFAWVFSNIVARSGSVLVWGFSLVVRAFGLDSFTFVKSTVRVGFRVAFGLGLGSIWVRCRLEGSSLYRPPANFTKF
jgi:hypothetical protein